VHHSTIVPKLTPSLAKANQFRSGEGGPLAQARTRAGEQRTLRGLAQASPFSPRRDHSSLKK